MLKNSFQIEGFISINPKVSSKVGYISIGYGWKPKTKYFDITVFDQELIKKLKQTKKGVFIMVEGYLWNHKTATKKLQMIATKLTFPVKKPQQRRKNVR